MKIKSKELLLKNLGNDDSIPDNPFTSLEKLRKYLTEGKSNDSRYNKLFWRRFDWKG